MNCGRRDVLTKHVRERARTTGSAALSQSRSGNLLQDIGAARVQANADALRLYAVVGVPDRGESAVRLELKLTGTLDRANID
jgi:hypothetical protein